MTRNKKRSAMASLKARRQVLLRELAGVEQQVVQAEQDLNRLHERIRMLERGQRRAA